MVTDIPWKKISIGDAKKAASAPGKLTPLENKITTSTVWGVTTQQKVLRASSARPNVTGAAAAFRSTAQIDERVVRTQNASGGSERPPWCDVFGISPWVKEKSY